MFRSKGIEERKFGSSFLLDNLDQKSAWVRNTYARMRKKGLQV